MQGNVELAKAIKAVSEASWQPQSGEYSKKMRDCIIEVVGPDDPIALVLICLFTAGYSEMWDFVDHVLGERPREPPRRCMVCVTAALEASD